MSNGNTATRAPDRARFFGIGAKLYLYLGVSLALILLASVIGARAFVHALDLQERIGRDSFPQIQSALQLSQRIAGLLSVSHAVLDSDGSALGADAAELAARENGKREVESALTIALMESRRLIVSALERAEATSPQTAALTRLRDRTKSFNARVDALRAGQADAGQRGLGIIERELVRDAERLSLDAVNGARTVSEEASQALRQALRLFLVLNLTGYITLGISVWLFVRRVIVRRVGILATSMRQMTAGELDIAFDVGGADELTDMGYALDIFREHAIKVQRLNLVEKLSIELQDKNKALEGALADVRKAQDQVIHQEKLAALGQLTAGVAHEIQNPLNFIMNFSIGSHRLVTELEELIGTTTDGDPDGAGIKEIAGEINEITGEINDSLNRVIEHSKRADNIVKAMLLHSRTSSNQRSEVDINAVLSEYANLAYHSQRAHNSKFNLTIRRELGTDTGTVSAVAQEIGRVVLNLVTNACQATAERAIRENATYAPELALASGRNTNTVWIKIRDNGGGIPAEVRAHIFEPFFTTKSGESGTGLGLSISHDIVHAHGGELAVDCVEDESTEFTMSLPLAER